MNEVRLKGRVAKDPELRGTADKPFCFLTVACDREFSAGADFIDTKAFGALAESCAMSLKKGDLVAVSGRLAKSRYEKEGREVYSMAVIVDSVAKINRTSQNVSRSVQVIDETGEEDVTPS